MAGTIDEDFIVGQLRSFYKFANNLANEEKRFEYIFNQINSTEECMESSATKNTLIKRMVTWALKEFNATKFRSDVRMLTFWKLLGKYSTEMKTEGVLSEVDRLGFFKTTPEFYVLWAEYWASQNSRKKFERAMQLCKENCALDEYQSDELFGPIIRKYYKDTTMNFDGDRTRALFNYLNEKPPALAIPNLSTETTAPMNAVVKNLQPKEEFSVFCDRTAIVEEPAPAKCSSVKVSAAAVIKSPAQKQRRISVNPELFAECDETVAGAHGRFGTEHGLATSTPRRSVMPGQIPDISLFSPMVSDNHEAAPKEQRRSIYSLPSTLKQPQFATRISFGQSGNMEPTTRHQVHTSSAYDRKSIAAKTVELSKAMPQLKINSTIDEVSEGRENANETTRVDEPV